MNRNGHPNLDRSFVAEADENTVNMLPHRREKSLKDFAKIWIHKPIPADFMSDLASILEDDFYTPEKRVHKIVIEAMKWGLDQ